MLECVTDSAKAVEKIGLMIPSANFNLPPTLENILKSSAFIISSPIEGRNIIYHMLVSFKVNGNETTENGGVLLERVIAAQGVANVKMTKSNRRQNPEMFSACQMVISAIRAKLPNSSSNMITASFGDYYMIGQLHARKLPTFAGSYDSVESALLAQCYSTLKTCPQGKEEEVMNRFKQILQQWVQGIYQLSESATSPIDLYCIHNKQDVLEHLSKEDPIFQNKVNTFFSECFRTASSITPITNPNFIKEKGGKIFVTCVQDPNFFPPGALKRWAMRSQEILQEITSNSTKCINAEDVSKNLFKFIERSLEQGEELNSFNKAFPRGVVPHPSLPELLPLDKKNQAQKTAASS